MKKGINCWAMVADSVEEMLDLAVKSGYDGIELTVAEGTEINFSSTKEEMLKIRDMAEAKGIKIYSLTNTRCWQYTLTSPKAEERETAKNDIKKQLDIASWLGCETILIIPGIVCNDENSGTTYEQAYERAFAAIKELAPYAEKCGVKLCVENVWNKFLLSPTEFAAFIDSISSDYVCAYFDVGNIMAYGYPQDWIRTLGSRIKAVHFKDFKVAEHQFVDILEGDVNYPEVMKAFAETGYEGWATAEVFPYKYYKNSLLYVTSVAMDIILGRKEI